MATIRGSLRMAKLCQDGQQEKCDPRLRPRRAQLIDIVGIQSHLCSSSAVSMVNLHESGGHEGTAKCLYIASCSCVGSKPNFKHLICYCRHVVFSLLGSSSRGSRTSCSVDSPRTISLNPNRGYALCHSLIKFHELLSYSCMHTSWVHLSVYLAVLI